MRNKADTLSRGCSPRWGGPEATADLGRRQWRVPRAFEKRLNDSYARHLLSDIPRMVHRMLATAPLKTAGLEGQYDLRVRVHGGGISGQAGAVRHGIARALVDADPELRVPLKRQGFLTRDARKVERKKAGLHKARKAPQFSKR